MKADALPEQPVELNDIKTNFASKIFKFAGRRELTLFAVAGVFILAGLGFYLLIYNGPPKIVTNLADGECVGWVKKLEGSNYKNIGKLDCQLTPRKIANSSLKAQLLDYSASDIKGCLFDPGFSGESQNPGCTSWRGVVVSNGKSYSGVGEPQLQYPSNIDYCYDREEDAPQSKPTTHDLYFYKGDLYDRDVFKSVETKTDYGGYCVLNGTTLYRPASSPSQYDGLPESFITNVTADYHNFPTDCFTVTIGLSVDSEDDCVDFLAAANLDLDACYTSKDPIVKNNLITGYKTEYEAYYGQYDNQGCERTYVVRLAALGQCQELTNHTLYGGYPQYLPDCSKMVDNPAINVVRLHQAI